MAQNQHFLLQKFTWNSQISTIACGHYLHGMCISCTTERYSLVPVCSCYQFYHHTYLGLPLSTLNQGSTYTSHQLDCNRSCKHWSIDSPLYDSIHSSTIGLVTLYWILQRTKCGGRSVRHYQHNSLRSRILPSLRRMESINDADIKLNSACLLLQEEKKKFEEEQYLY